MIFILVGGYIIFFCVTDESIQLFIYFLETTVYDLKSYVLYKGIRLLKAPDLDRLLCAFLTSERYRKIAGMYN